MVSYSPSNGKWQIGNDAAEIHRLKATLTAEAYEAQKDALKSYLCQYFSSGLCNHALGDSISPLKATEKGGKVLKVRWGYPGCGKSGSLRLIVVAYCDELRVHIAGAFPRKSDPTDEAVLDCLEGY